MSRTICCMHHQPRIDSPEPPSRRPPPNIASIDSIFTVAALPEDHPHAPKSICERKAKEAGVGILRSPDVKEKLRLKFGRKSMWSLKREDGSGCECCGTGLSEGGENEDANLRRVVGEAPSLASGQFDCDACAMTSQEVFQQVGHDGHSGSEAVHVHGRRFGSPSSVTVGSCGGEPTEEPNAGIDDMEVGSSVLANTKVASQNPAMRSLEWLGPILQGNTAEANVSDIAFRVSANGPDETSPSVHARLPRCLTSPLLSPDSNTSEVRPPRRTKSAVGIGSFLPTASVTTPSMKPRSKSSSSYDLVAIPSQQDRHEEEAAAEMTDSASPLDEGLIDVCHDQPESAEPSITEQLDSAGVHLYEMDISQVLRSLSQMTETHDDEDISNARHSSWTFHKRERSDSGVAWPSKPQHTRADTSMIDTASIPSAWGRKQSPVREVSPSIYSRPCSADNDLEEAVASIDDRAAYDIPAEPDAVLVDWPLKTTECNEGIAQHDNADSLSFSVIVPQHESLPSSPDNQVRIGPGAGYPLLASEQRAPPEHPPRSLSIPSKNSAASLESRNSKASCSQQQDKSAVNKTVKKRRSIFKFLRPASRRAARCVSSPVLRIGALYDGPADEQELVTVEYEMSGVARHRRPTGAQRTQLNGEDTQQRPDGPASLYAGADSAFPAWPPSEVASFDTRRQSSAPNILDRRQSFADYERQLSVTGDSRRRPSAVDLQRLQQIQEEDRDEPLRVRRRLSRANAVVDDANPLMASALQKHQEEKAMFRSESKRRESVAAGQLASVDLSSSPFAAGAKSVPASIMEETDEMLNPLDKAELAPKARSHLGIPQTSLFSRNRKRSATGDSTAMSLKASPASSIPTPTPSLRTVSDAPLPHTPKALTIGTELESWSRFPSHTRTERCASAGKADAVSMNDFAVLATGQDKAHPTGVLASPVSKVSTKASSKTKSSEKSQRALRKSTSMSFGNIIRYYHDIFTNSGFAGKNRRTSVSVGGLLQHPELEMLPPTTGTEHHHNHHRHLKEVEERLWDQAAKVNSTPQQQQQQQQQHHHHSKAHSASAIMSSPFRQGSIFSAQPLRSSRSREDSLIPPEKEEEVDATGTLYPPDGNTALTAQATLDGTHEGTVMEHKSSPVSKAKAWSEVYRECLVAETADAAVGGRIETEDAGRPSSSQISKAGTDCLLMPPPLKPVKPRSPQTPKQLLDPNLRIRKFPSVTVLDDRKGHVRSVSMISSQSLESMKSKRGLVRTSTYDLVELIQQREREAMEKLLGAVAAA